MIELSYLIALASGVIVSYLFIIGHIIMYAVSKLGIRTYTIKSTSTIAAIQDNVRDYCICFTDNDKPTGYFMSRRFIDNISSEKDGTSITLITTPDILKELTAVTTEVPSDHPLDYDDNDSGTALEVGLRKYLNEKREKQHASRSIIIYARATGYWSFRRLHLGYLSPRPEQREYISSICDVYNRGGVAVAYINGPTGCGKTLLGMLLALHYESSLCKWYDPTELGESLSSLWDTARPTREKPLIFLLDEVDTIIGRVHTSAGPRTTGSTIGKRTEVLTKTDWNGLFDDIRAGIYPNTIVLLTSNVPAADIDRMDPSYIRPGRVNLRIEYERR